MVESTYKVVWPLGKSTGVGLAATRLVSDLTGKTVCELWDGVFRGAELFPALRESLRKRYPGIGFVDYSVFGQTRGPKGPEVMAALPDLLRKYGCDAVISGIGG